MATKPTQMRLGDDVLAMIDRLAEHYREHLHIDASRAEVVRIVVREAYARQQKKTSQKARQRY